jgi:carboxylesterase type B
MLINDARQSVIQKVALCAALLACCATATAALGADALPPAIQTDGGAVSGIPTVNPAVRAFKGIPFAAPPIGELRWTPPVAPAKWTGVRAADHFGPSCTQAVRNAAPTGRDLYRTQTRNEISEDCLYLNVWTPAKSAAAKLPVMVWIFGGGFMAGSPAEASFDGAGLAGKNVVVVTINYRLGILGFLAHPDLDKESPHHVSGNYGTLDQIAALQWVAHNIAAFGGDPGRVTIFGQSAGGGSVHFLSTSPLARGLFQRAISENGLLFADDPFLLERSPSAYKKLDEAEADDLAYLRKAGVESLQQLRAMSPAQLLALPPAPFPPAFYSPSVDGWVLPQDFGATYAAGKQSDVPYMTGWTSAYYPELKITVADYQKWANARFGPMAAEYLTLYPAASDDEASRQVEEAARDSYRASIFLWAESRGKHVSSKTFTYYYNHPLAGAGYDKFGSGAGHEIPYVFHSLFRFDRPFVQNDYAIEDMMSSYWVNFATTGDPNGKGLPRWPVFDTKSTVTMQLGDDSGPIPVASEAKFGFFKRFFASHPPKCSFAQTCSIDMQ